MRQLQPTTPRPFKLSAHVLCCHTAFYICNLMLYWCGFGILWKLDIALVIGLIISLMYQHKKIVDSDASLYWFVSYMASLLVFSYLGSFGGIRLLTFPIDLACLLPFSVVFLILSQKMINQTEYTNKLNEADLRFS